MKVSEKLKKRIEQTFDCKVINIQRNYVTNRLRSIGAWVWYAQVEGIENIDEVGSTYSMSDCINDKTWDTEEGNGELHIFPASKHLKHKPIVKKIGFIPAPPLFGSS